MTRSKSSKNVQSTYLLLAHIWNQIYIQQQTKQRWFLPSKGQPGTYLQDTLHLFLACWHFSEARIRKLGREGEMKEAASHHLTCQKDSELQRRGCWACQAALAPSGCTAWPWHVDRSTFHPVSRNPGKHETIVTVTNRLETLKLPSVTSPQMAYPLPPPLEARTEQVVRICPVSYYRWHMGPHKKLTGSKTSQTELVWTFEFLFFNTLAQTASLPAFLPPDSPPPQIAS